MLWDSNPVLDGMGIAAWRMEALEFADAIYRWSMIFGDIE